MKTYIIIGALAFGFGAAALRNDDLGGVWLLAWPLGALVGFVVWSLVAGGPRAARKVEAYRPRAVELRVENPELYEQILGSAEGQAALAAANDPDAYVALWLFHAERQIPSS